jgi:hypothetical protein
MIVQPVRDATTERLFLDLPDIIYRGDASWVKPLDKDMNAVFNPEKNKAFKHGQLMRWILLDDHKNTIGRIAAFVNKRYKSKGDEFPVGGIGFFECINNQDAANILFDQAKAWLYEQGMEAMDGPINFGERDRWWGLLRKGFYEPLYCMNYNPPYYVELFESYGFEIFFHQYCFGLNLNEPLSARIWDRHAIIAQNPDFKAIHASKKDINRFADDFAYVYNKAWAGHGGMKQLSNEQARLIFQTMKPVMDEKLLWYTYHKDEPIAIFTNIPDLNQWFRHLNGKFGLWQKLRFLWMKRFKPNTKFNGLAFGIIPEFQGQGIDSFMIGEAAKLLQSPKLSYRQYELQWIGDFNPKMLNIARNLGDVSVSRELATYRYLFDRTKPFKRHPIL